jgi:hypothetical protein
MCVGMLKQGSFSLHLLHTNQLDTLLSVQLDLHLLVPAAAAAAPVEPQQPQLLV